MVSMGSNYFKVTELSNFCNVKMAIILAHHGDFSVCFLKSQRKLEVRI